MSRKGWCILLVVCLSVVTTASTDAAQSGGTDAGDHTVEVAEGVYAWGSPPSGYFSMFVVTSNGVMVVEPANLHHSQGLLQAIRQVTDEPIRYLFHSHNHWDHSFGGQVFRDEGATIIAHHKAVEWMNANPHAQLAQPDFGWTGSRKDITLGGTTIELHHFGMSHGMGMTVFRLPREKIVFIADIVTPKRLLFTIVPDFNIKEWVRTLQEIEKLDFDTAIFTHGAAQTSRRTVNSSKICAPRSMRNSRKARIHFRSPTLSSCRSTRIGQCTTNG